MPPHLAGQVRRGDFLACFEAEADLAPLADALTRAYQVVAVLVGSETGVGAADRLAALLRCPGNSSATTAYRRDKSAAAGRLAACGLRAPRQALCANAQEAARWANANGYPVAVKQRDGAGAEGFRLCRSEEEVRATVAGSLDQVSYLGLPVQALLVQEYLRGTQYTINTVSWAGRHQVTEIWRQRTIYLPGEGVVFDFDELLPRRGQTQDRLVEYTFACLSALGFEYGPGHTELMDTPAGPVLFDPAARLQGGLDFDVVEQALGAGDSQLARLVRLVTRPADREEVLGREYVLDKSVRWLQLIAGRSGRVVETPLEAELRALPTCSALHLKVRPGDQLRRTVDLVTSPGELFLVGGSEQVQRDWEAARAIEKRGWVLEPLGGSSA
jgi:biotin carboxylase